MDTEGVVIRTCGDEDVSSGRGAGQLDWYRFAARYVENKSVLDAGCGLGQGLRILQSRAALAEGQDLDPRLATVGVRIGPLEDVASKSYDVVVSIDVIEHVEDPQGFVAELARVAREGIFLTTPNWTASRCQWPFHLREYTPAEFQRLLARVGEVSLFKGTPSGSAVYSVRYPSAYHVFNSLRSWWPTAFPARCVNVSMPARCKIHSHNAAWVRIQ